MADHITKNLFGSSTKAEPPGKTNEAGSQAKPARKEKL